MENLLEIGQIVNTHGLRGDVKVMPWCDDPELFHELEYVLIDEKEYAIEKSSIHKNMVLLKLEGIDHINDAEAYRNKVLFVPREELGELPEGRIISATCLAARLKPMTEEPWVKFVT